jgi:predicted RNase H-like HicB family nuclease
MKTVKIVIERSQDTFWAYTQNLEGINGAGDTVQKAKQSVLDAIDIQKELGNIPNIQYKLKYKFDTESLLKYYNGIFTNAALERITGINQKQLQHYSTGHRSPRPVQAKKIEQGLHNLAHELLAIEL